MLTYAIACILWLLALGNLWAGHPLMATFCGCTALCLWTVELTGDHYSDTDELAKESK